MPQPSRVRSFLLSDPSSTRPSRPVCGGDVQQEWFLDPNRIGARPANRVAPHPSAPHVYNAPPLRSVSIDTSSMTGGWIDAIDAANTIVEGNLLEPMYTPVGHQPPHSRSSSPNHFPTAPTPTTAPRNYLVRCVSDPDGYDVDTIESCFLPSTPQRQPTHQPLQSPLVPPVMQQPRASRPIVPPVEATPAPPHIPSSAPLLVPSCILELQSTIADTEKRNKKIKSDAAVLQTRTELEKLKISSIQSRVDGLQAASLTPPRRDTPVDEIQNLHRQPEDSSRRGRLEALRAAELKYKRLNATLHNALSSPHWNLDRESSTQL